MRIREKIKVAAGIVVVCGAVGFFVLAQAGDLEPSSPPAPTMKTLEEVYNRPIWDLWGKKFVDWPANPRFAIYDGLLVGWDIDDMVLDKETGLVWARDANAAGMTMPWISAVIWCYGFDAGERRGWRMPTVEELGSLMDTASHPDAPLPEGHPFINVQAAYYWSSTNYKTVALDHAWVTKMDTGTGILTSKDKTESHYLWPVRGGSGPALRTW